MIFNLTPPPESTAVEFIEQTLTDTQKAQARTNIGALSIDDVPGGGMELLGEAYVDSSSQGISELKLPIPSGYTYYYMPLVIGSVGNILVSCANKRYGVNPSCFILNGENSSVTYDYNDPASTHNTDLIQFGNVTGSSSALFTGYLLWHIRPSKTGYVYRTCLFACGTSRLYYGRNEDNSIYTLDQCTPTSITISGRNYSYLKLGTGVTVYGIK